MIRINRLRVRLAKADEGIAMVMVIAISLILMLLVTVAVGSALSGFTKSRSDQNWNAAIAAAYAGIEDYKAKIADDNRYYLYGNPSSPYSTANSPQSTLPTGVLANPAFGLGTTGTWKQVNNSPGAYFRYEVDTTSYNTTGVLRLRSTGRVGDETRSVVANLKPKGFIDYLYYTTYEINDPAISGVNVGNCVKYAWNGRANTGCSELSFGDTDVMTGPVHSNDTIRACGATFGGAVTTGYKPAAGQLAYKRWDSNANACDSGDTETFSKGAPVWTGTMDLPPTNSKMRNEVRTDLLVDVPHPGCLYTGPTSIIFLSNGDMTVRSPWTKATQVAGDPATSGTTPTACGTTGVGTTGAPGLGSASGQTIHVPPNNLIFVQNVTIQPALTSDPNVWKANTYPSGITSASCAAGNNIGYPTTNENYVTVATAYGCTNGDLFVKGDVNAEVTLVAENLVYVTGDIRYVATNPTAILGLVAQNSVLVWNPMKSCTSTGSGCVPILGLNRRIDAAILSVKHVFTAQNYSVGGNRGTLTVNGAIAQLFRGPMRSTSTSNGVTTILGGYAKNYIYEWRLQSVAPPKFLSPVSTTYQVREVVEVKSAFNPDGSSGSTPTPTPTP